MIYTTNFLRKYKNLIILTQHNNKENKEFDLWNLKMYNNYHTEYGEIIYSIVELYTSIFFCEDKLYFIIPYDVNVQMFHLMYHTWYTENMLNICLLAMI